MLRSSSINNLQDRKSNSFLNSFRSKKADSTSSTSSETPRKHRPLSQSFSSINLNQKYNISLENTLYLSTVRRERNGADKENSLASKRASNQISSPTTATATTAANPATTGSNANIRRKLSTRSSAPNLKANKRHSMLFPGNYNYNSILEPVKGYNTTSPIIDILPDEIAADKTNNSYESSESSIDDSTHSPYTPDDFHSTLDPLMDHSPITIDTDFEYDYIPENEGSYLYEKQHHHTLSSGSSGSNLSRRRINAQELGLGDIFKLIDDDENSARLPINNRKSLEFENLERLKIAERLQTDKVEKDVVTENYSTTLKLVANAIFVGIEQNSKPDSLMTELDDGEYMRTLGEEPYENGDEDFYMKI